jgi:hypothetical protein
MLFVTKVMMNAGTNFMTAMELRRKLPEEMIKNYNVMSKIGTVLMNGLEHIKTNSLVLMETMTNGPHAGRSS